MIEVIIASALRRSTPLVLASLGAVYSERSGVVNIGLEGIMLMGAFVSVVASNAFGPLTGVMLAVMAGMALAALHALATVTFKADQIVSGVAINLLGMGVTAFIPEALLGMTDVRSSYSATLFLGLTPLVYVALALVPLSHFLIFHTVFGLRLRSVGENPRSADSLGINVDAMRYLGVIISGALAALGGAYLALEQSGGFTKNMVAGRGFIALAAMIFGNWSPFGALGASLLFGFADSAQTIVQTMGYTIPPQAIQALPYILTIVVLVLAVRRVKMPEADGKPYIR
jgi:simple sugar transport system permease protein